MHDSLGTDASDMKYPILAERVRYFKEDEKGVATMCKAMEDMRNEAAREATFDDRCFKGKSLEFWHFDIDFSESCSERALIMTGSIALPLLVTCITLCIDEFIGFCIEHGIQSLLNACANQIF